MTNEETIQDALKWVKTLIEHYKARYEPARALDGVLGEIKTCITIGEMPECEGTRFVEARDRLLAIGGKQ